IITERNVHPGALVGPTNTTPLLRLHQVSRLRPVVAVPEALSSAASSKARVGRSPSRPTPASGLPGTSASPRLPSILKSGPWELDVRNPDLRLGAGVYPEVQWPVKRSQPSLLVPPTSIVTTTERSFVIRVKGVGTAEWVDVSRGARVGDLVEVFGSLKEGEVIVRRGTDELRPGAKVNPQPRTS